MKITVLGLGLMGRAIAGRLNDLGFGVTGWNRSAEAADKAGAAGVAASTDPTVAEGADLLLLALSDAAAIDRVLFDDPGFALTGRTVLQMGTIAPDESRRLADQVIRAGGHYLEAPVLGSLPEAGGGSLIIMAGGDKPEFERCRPILEALGEAPRLVGPVGKGAALKLAMNQLIAGLTTAFAASLGLVRAEGIDIGLFMELLRGSALYAPTFDKKLEKMLRRDYANPNFPLQHLLKDTRLFATAAAARKIDTRSVDAIAALLESAIAAGYAEDDYSALYESVNPGTQTR